MSVYFYTPPDPYPTTLVSHTYPEKGHRLHHIPVHYWAHQFHEAVHNHDQDVHLPRADIRETLRNFYLEIEVPGISDQAQLHLRWTSSRTLLVSTKIARPEIPEDELYDYPTVASSNPASTTAPADEKDSSTTAQETSKTTTTTTPPPQPTKKQPHLTLHERRIGDILRAFNFPVDVDRDDTHGKLLAGLLRIVVPKVEHDDTKHVAVPVKAADATAAEKEAST